MKILHPDDKEKFLSYHKLKSLKKEAPYIIFHHGLMSNMDGSKALWLQRYCTNKGYGFIRFDNFGHGQSSGEFSDQTISTWCEGLNLIIDNINRPVLLVGSSMGGWISMLAAVNRPQDIIGMVGISSAPDFTEELLWDKLSAKEQSQMKTDGIYDVKGTDPDCSYTYPISYKLIEDGRQHLLLDKDNIDIKCPLHLLHGSKDIDVPASISERVFEKVSHNNVTLKVIKDAHHSLSREQDMQMVGHSIEEILKANY